MTHRIEVVKTPSAEVTTKNGNKAQPKGLRVTLDFDLTDGGTVTTGRLPDAVAAIAEGALQVIEKQGWEPKVKGTWEWVYGPLLSGRIREVD